LIVGAFVSAPLSSADTDAGAGSGAVAPAGWTWG
jgi:hypothetical protein